MLCKLAALALAALLAAPLTATAIPVTYQIKFTTITGSVSTYIPATPSAPSFSHEVDAAGKVYFGLFAVDDEILLTDGINKPGNVDFFYIQMEDNIWGYNLAADNSFVGFRGPVAGDGSWCPTECMAAQSPGFDVVNGAITNLRGGVYGRQDSPFVDFSLFGPNTFNARGYPLTNGAWDTFVGIGTMEIFRVPEPATLSLFGFGVLVLTLSIRRTAGRLASAH